MFSTANGRTHLTVKNGAVEERKKVVTRKVLPSIAAGLIAVLINAAWARADCYADRRDQCAVVRLVNHSGVTLNATFVATLEYDYLRPNEATDAILNPTDSPSVDALYDEGMGDQRQTIQWHGGFNGYLDACHIYLFYFNPGGAWEIGEVLSKPCQSQGPPGGSQGAAGGSQPSGLNSEQADALNGKAQQLSSEVEAGQLTAAAAASRMDAFAAGMGVTGFADYRSWRAGFGQTLAAQESAYQQAQQQKAQQQAQIQAQQQAQLQAQQQQQARQQAYQEQLRQQQQAQQRAADAAKQRAIDEFQRKQAEKQKLAASYLNQAQQSQSNMTQFFLNQAQAYSDIDRKYEERQRELEAAQAQEEAAQQAADAQQAQQQQAAARAQEQAYQEQQRQMAPPPISTDDLPDFDQLLARSTAGSSTGATVPKALPAKKQARVGAGRQEISAKPKSPSASSASSGGYTGLACAPADGGEGVAVLFSSAGSPAAEAGIQAGDVITSMNGKKISSTRQFLDALSNHYPGDQIELEYMRDGRAHLATIKVADRPAN